MLLPHPVGSEDFRERQREPLCREKLKCSRKKGSSSVREKLKILKKSFFDFYDVLILYHDFIRRRIMKYNFVFWS